MKLEVFKATKKETDVTNGGLSGLVKRRKAETQMFKENVSDSTR